MYDKLIKELREYWNDGTEDLRNQAADAIEGLLHAVDQMTEWRKNQWIPVTERLPEDYEQVLTCDERGNIHIFSHLRDFKYPFGIRPENPRYFMPKWWMPLPQPPESEGE